MKIALTGATGFLGRYILNHLSSRSDSVRAGYRPGGTRPFHVKNCTWVATILEDEKTFPELVSGCEAVVHAALFREGRDWSGGENLRKFLHVNFNQTIELIEASIRAGVKKFLFVSSCAVHDRILGDRTLDETHPLYPNTHYGAYKAAVEAFIHSFAAKSKIDICSIRPTGIYGLAEPPQRSKWFELIKACAAGEQVECSRGGKEVHAADVAKAVRILLEADGTSGEAYNCYDRYISEWEVAHTAREIAGSNPEILGEQTRPKNQIRTDKLQALGMTFGGDALLRETIADIIKS